MIGYADVDQKMLLLIISQSQYITFYCGQAFNIYFIKKNKQVNALIFLKILELASVFIWVNPDIVQCFHLRLSMGLSRSSLGIFPALLYV